MSAAINSLYTYITDECAMISKIYVAHLFFLPIINTLETYGIQSRMTLLEAKASHGFIITLIKGSLFRTDIPIVMKLVFQKFQKGVPTVRECAHCYCITYIAPKIPLSML